MTNKVDLHAYVKGTTEIAKGLEVMKRIKAASAVSAKTAKTYQRQADRRMDLTQDHLGPLMDGVSARSWHATRAALLHAAALKSNAARRDCDAAQKRGDIEAAWRSAIIARRALEAIQRIEGSKRPELTRKRATKRRSLPGSDTWQEVAYNAATPTQKPAIAVMWATGCRPAEIEAGVELRHATINGDPAVAVIIAGAKVTATAGQPERIITIDVDTPAGRALAAAIPPGYAGMLIDRRAKRLNADLADIRSRTGLRISPYSFRHQVSANVKAELAGEDVAKVLGHVATRSQYRYGSIRQAQSGGTGIKGVTASRPVRETRPPAPAPRSGPQPL